MDDRPEFVGPVGEAVGEEVAGPSDMDVGGLVREVIGEEVAEPSDNEHRLLLSKGLSTAEYEFPTSSCRTAVTPLFPKMDKSSASSGSTRVRYTHPSGWLYNSILY